MRDDLLSDMQKADVLTQTAPEHIWLQVNTAGDDEDRSEAFPDNQEQTWCANSISGQEVKYVRADLFAEARQAIEGLVKEKDALRFLLAKTRNLTRAPNNDDRIAIDEALKEPR